MVPCWPPSPDRKQHGAGTPLSPAVPRPPDQGLTNEGTWSFPVEHAVRTPALREHTGWGWGGGAAAGSSIQAMQRRSPGGSRRRNRSFLAGRKSEKALQANGRARAWTGGRGGGRENSALQDGEGEYWRRGGASGFHLFIPSRGAWPIERLLSRRYDCEHSRQKPKLTLSWAHIFVGEPGSQTNGPRGVWDVRC